MRRGRSFFIFTAGDLPGTSADTASITSRLARDTGAVVVSVDYRMAPEWPFPYAVEDCYAVYRALIHEAARLGGMDEISWCRAIRLEEWQRCCFDRT